VGYFVCVTLPEPSAAPLLNPVRNLPRIGTRGEFPSLLAEEFERLSFLVIEQEIDVFRQISVGIVLFAVSAFDDCFPDAFDAELQRTFERIDRFGRRAPPRYPYGEHERFAGQFPPAVCQVVRVTEFAFVTEY